MAELAVAKPLNLNNLTIPDKTLAMLERIFTLFEKLLDRADKILNKLEPEKPDVRHGENKSGTALEPGKSATIDFSKYRINGIPDPKNPDILVYHPIDPTTDKPISINLRTHQANPVGDLLYRYGPGSITYVPRTEPDGLNNLLNNVVTANKNKSSLV